MAENSTPTEPIEDVLSSFVSQLGLKSSVFGRVGLSAPFGLCQSRYSEMTFHLLLRGECYYGIGESEYKFCRFSPGDFVLFPRGAPHVLVSSPRAEVVPSKRVCYTTTTSHGDRFQNGRGKKSEFICGSFALSGSNAAVLSGALPEVISFRAKGQKRNRWIRSTLELLAHEVAERSDGSERLIGQLLDTLFVQILRFYMAEQDAQGIFAAMKDPAMMRVLTRLCVQFEKPWTIESLARDSGYSRTALAVKFQAFFGQGVATFLRNQRLMQAKVKLEQSALSIKEVAGAVGFGGSEVFIRNFERVYGLSPQRFREAAGAQLE